MSTIEGRDPRTGEVLRVHTASDHRAPDHRGGGRTITAIERFTSDDATLPFLTPGLVDLQVNGFAGLDVNAEDVDVDTLAGITEALAAIGVTTWVPTVITAPEERIIHALRTVAAARKADPRLARAIPFAHVEGPFIAATDGARGAHDVAHIRPIDPDEVTRWRAAGPVGYVTLSPHPLDDVADQPEAPDPVVARGIAAIVAGRVTVALGHTAASPAQVRAAVDAGATLSTHLGNGTAAMLPRHPNHLWTQLADDRLRCGLIADGHHLDTDTLAVMLRAAGPRAFLVSDAVALAGSTPGRHRTPVGGAVTLHPDGRLTHDASGLLAGAAASLADGLCHVVARVGIPLAEAVALTSARPGAIAGRIASAQGNPAVAPGQLTVGAPADLVLLASTGRVLEAHRA